MKDLWVLKASLLNQSGDLGSDHVVGLYRRRKKAIRDFNRLVGQTCKWSKSPSSGAWRLITEVPGLVYASIFRFRIDEAIGSLSIKQAIHDALLRDEIQANPFNRYFNEDDASDDR